MHLLKKYMLYADQCWSMQALKAQGMVAPFDPRPAGANFSRISTTPLFITDVLQSVSGTPGGAGTSASGRVGGGLSC
jgi:hypothetical protein